MSAWRMTTKKKKKERKHSSVATDKASKLQVKGLLKESPSLVCASFLGLRASLRLRQMGSVTWLPFPELSPVSPGFCQPCPHR